MSEAEQAVANNGETNVAELFSHVPTRKNKRILLVDEDPLRRASLLQKLRVENFDVEVASNTIVALEKLPGGELTAILLDLTGADSPGLDFIKAERRDPEFASRPIFVCTDAMVSRALARDADRG